MSKNVLIAAKRSSFSKMQTTTTTKSRVIKIPRYTLRTIFPFQTFFLIIYDIYYLVKWTVTERKIKYGDIIAHIAASMDSIDFLCKKNPTHF